MYPVKAGIKIILSFQCVVIIATATAISDAADAVFDDNIYLKKKRKEKFCTLQPGVENKMCIVYM